MIPVSERVCREFPIKQFRRARSKGEKENIRLPYDFQKIAETLLHTELRYREITAENVVKQRAEDGDQTAIARLKAKQKKAEEKAAKKQQKAKEMEDCIMTDADVDDLQTTVLAEGEVPDNSSALDNVFNFFN